MTTTIRTSERIEFLTDLLIGAIESYPYSWFVVDEYEPNAEPGQAYAVITEDDDFGKGDTHRVDLDVIERGIEVIRKAELRARAVGRRTLIVDDVAHEYVTGGEIELHNVETGECLFMGESLRRAILAADKANDAAGDGEEDDLDVIAYLAVLECGLFGRVVYG